MFPQTAHTLKDDRYYHITTCGRQEQRLFEGDFDYMSYLKLLEKYKRQFQIRIYAFCLMPDYVYLISRCFLSSQLSFFIHRTNLAYALYFNKKYRRSGCVWQRQLKIVLLKKNTLWSSVQHIESTPLRLRITQVLSDYPWSSFRHRKEWGHTPF